MKVIPDTNVWIEFFRNPNVRVDFESRTHRPILYISSVVVMELYAGCRTSRQRESLTKFLKPFEKAERVVGIDDGCFREAGRVLAALGNAGIGNQHRRQNVNDVLIAVSASRAGAVVITANERDFSAIGRYIPLRWNPPA